MKFSEFREKVPVKFSVDSSRYLIAKLKVAPEFSDEVFSVVRDKNEVTVVAKEGLELQSISEQKFFKLITFDVTLPFELTGFSHKSPRFWRAKAYLSSPFLLIRLTTCLSEKKTWTAL